VKFITKRHQLSAERRNGWRKTYWVEDSVRTARNASMGIARWMSPEVQITNRIPIPSTARLDRSVKPVPVTLIVIGIYTVRFRKNSRLLIHVRF